MECKGQLQVYL